MFIIIYMRNWIELKSKPRSQAVYTLPAIQTAESTNRTQYPRDTGKKRVGYICLCMCMCVLHYVWVAFHLSKNSKMRTTRMMEKKKGFRQPLPLREPLTIEEKEPSDCDQPLVICFVFCVTSSANVFCLLVLFLLLGVLNPLRWKQYEWENDGTMRKAHRPWWFLPCIVNITTELIHENAMPIKIC